MKELNAMVAERESLSLEELIDYIETSGFSKFLNDMNDIHTENLISYINGLKKADKPRLAREKYWYNLGLLEAYKREHLEVAEFVRIVKNAIEEISDGKIVELNISVGKFNRDKRTMDSYLTSYIKEGAKILCSSFEKNKDPMLIFSGKNQTGMTVDLTMIESVNIEKLSDNDMLYKKYSIKFTYGNIDYWMHITINK